MTDPNVRKGRVRLYNILFPVWLLVLFPTPLWIVLIPLNYLIDLLVLRLSLRGHPDAKEISGNGSLAVCAAGFASDLAGSGLLFLIMLLLSESGRPGAQETAAALNMDPFRSIWSFLATLAAVLFSALLIYLLDRRILRKNGLEEGKAAKSALALALFTAPYLFFFPSRILYDIIGT